MSNSKRKQLPNTDSGAIRTPPALDAFPLAVAVWSKDGRLTSFNALFGELAQGQGRRISAGDRRAEIDNMFRRNVLEPVSQARGSLFTAGRNGGREITVQFIDGSWRQITNSRLATGETLTVIPDITEFMDRQLIAERSARRNAQMAVAISSMESGVFFTNPNLPDNPVVFANPSFTAPAGLLLNEILGKPFERMFKTKSAKSVHDELLRCLNQRKTVTAILNHSADGDPVRWFEYRLTPIFGENGRIDYCLGVQIDVTARKIAEEELRRRMERQSIVAELGRKALLGNEYRELFDDAAAAVSRELNCRLVTLAQYIPENGDCLILSGAGWHKNQYGRFRTSIKRRPDLQKLLSSTGWKRIDFSRAQLAKLPIKAVLKNYKHAVGIRIAGRLEPFGILIVHSIERRDYSTDDLNFLEHIAYVLGVAVERTEAESLIRESEHRFNLAVKGSNDGIWDWDIESGNVYYSDRWQAMLGFADSGLENNLASWKSRIHPEDRAEFLAELDSHLDGKSSYFASEHRLAQKDGSYRWMLARGLAVRDNEGRPIRVAGSLSDIHESKSAAHALMRDALHDNLTGLPNRALFSDRLTFAISRRIRNPKYLFAVLFLDFDRFKMINDSLGHSYGDQMLIEISHRLSECIRDVDTLARLGGDEFAILLEDITDESEAENVARRINQSLSDPFRLADKKIVSNASIGIAFSSLGYETPGEMIRDADIAMYQAKAEGRGRHVVFEKGMHVRAVTQLEIETDLRRAIEAEEFSLVFQPVVEIGTGKLSSFEALLRWHHPERGMVSPVEFIPIAEETRLIVPIGLWVLAEACRQMKRWQRKFKSADFSMGVNISPEQFAEPSLIDDIRNILEETRLDGACLKVEITESAIMENPQEVTIRLAQLREMGIQLYVDDFGTGYSSLSHLHRFPIDALKVDRSFVISMTESEENMEIVRTIVNLARNLNLKTVAEGVETVDDLNHLNSLGCDYAQGYYFSRPMDVKSATNYIAGRN